MKKPQAIANRKPKSRAHSPSVSTEVTVSVDAGADEYSVSRRRNAYQRAPFDAERLAQESLEVQHLFWAIQAVKALKNQALDQYQQQQAEVLNYRMGHEKQVREVKKASLAQTQGLLAEFNRIKRSTAREIHIIREQISL